MKREHVCSFFIIVLGLLLIPFFPALSNLLAVFVLVLSIHGRYAKGIIVFSVFLFLLSLSINAASYSQFLYHESDFTSYYNNFLSFNGGIKGDWFVYSGGIEVGLPLVNYILSFFIDNKPYLFLLTHLLIQTSLLIYFSSIVKARFNLSLFEFSVLLGFMFTFYKYLGMLNHMRQSYASLCILIALFTSGKKRNSFLLLSVIFHISTIVVYPLAYLIFISNNMKLKKKVIILSLPSALMFFFAFDFFGGISLIDNFLLEKLLFTFRERDDDTAYISSVLYSFIKVVYLIPLFFLNEVYSRRDFKYGFRLSLLCVIIPVLALSFLPSFISRIYEVVLITSCGLMYFYFYINALNNGRAMVRLVVVLFLLILNARWFFGDGSFYARYPLFSNEPFYYVEPILEESSKVSRFSLPSINDIDKNRVN